VTEELPAELAPLAFLIGRWRGSGVGGYPTIEDFPYEQELRFTLYGKPVLAYESRSWSPDGRPLHRECGYWRPRPGGEVELLLAHPTGVVEVYLGRVDGNRVELSTDVVARTPSAKEVTAGHRLYGLVGEELMYAVDMAAVEQPLQPHLSARLRRIGE
jgi:hypothetical protein